MPTLVFGSPLYPMPTVPSAPATVEFLAMNNVAISQSIFSGQQQIQNWNAAWLEASVSMPPLTHAQAQTWIAWILSLQGMAGVFQFGDPLAVAPRLGAGSGSAVVNGGGQTGTNLSIRGWTGTLSPGDWIQIGYRLYRVLETATGSGGTMAFAIWPQIRESPLDGAAITLTATKGLFRLKTNERHWSISAARVYGLQFDIREAF